VVEILGLRGAFLQHLGKGVHASDVHLDCVESNFGGFDIGAEDFLSRVDRCLAGVPAVLRADPGSS
jgi:hypothetical protein